MASAIEKLDRRFYPGYQDNWDDILFRQRILRHLRTDYTALDLGAGSGLVRQMDFRGLCRTVFGVDPDKSVLANPHLDIAEIGTAEAIPAPPNTFDLIFADNVLEHLPNPRQAFEEIRRTLKPGGIFLAKTPNRFHYVPLIAQMTPTSFHRFANRLRGRGHSDTFPTRYRANSKSRLVKLAAITGLQVVEIEQIEGRPEYTRISPLMYPFGLIWERTVNFTDLLSLFRVLLLATFRKLVT